MLAPGVFNVPLIYSSILARMRRRVKPALAHPWQAGQVSRVLHDCVAEPGEQPHTPRPLIMAMLEHEPATRCEMHPCGGRDGPDAVHAIRASEQRCLRLES